MKLYSLEISEEKDYFNGNNGEPIITREGACVFEGETGKANFILTESDIIYIESYLKHHCRKLAQEINDA